MHGRCDSEKKTGRITHKIEIRQFHVLFLKIRNLEKLFIHHWCKTQRS